MADLTTSCYVSDDIKTFIAYTYPPKKYLLFHDWSRIQFKKKKEKKDHKTMGSLTATHVPILYHILMGRCGTNYKDINKVYIVHTLKLLKS